MEKGALSQEIEKSDSKGQENEQVEVEEEEEYVLINLDNIAEQISIPPNAPYVLSGLDTPNPILIIDNKIKLIGEYEETMGTCIVFSETDVDPSQATAPRRTPAKQVNPITSLDKVLKFKLLLDAEDEGKAENQATNTS